MEAAINVDDEVYLVTVPDFTFKVVEVDVNAGEVVCMDRNGVRHTLPVTLLQKVAPKKST